MSSEEPGACGGQTGPNDMDSVRIKVLEEIGEHGDEPACESIKDVEGSVGGDVEKQKKDRSRKEVMDLVKILSSDADGGHAEKEEELTDTSSDDMIFLQMLPREIWEKVADYLDDGEDLYNLCKSSPFFEKLLESKKVLYLFPKVFDILGEKYLKNYWKRTVYNEMFDANAGVHVSDIEGSPCNSCGRSRRKRSLSGFLKIRLVCKVWRNAVDKMIRSYAYRQGDNLVVSGDSIGSSIIGNLWLYEFNWEVEHYSQFLRHFNESHGIPGQGGSRERSPFVSGHFLLTRESTLGMNVLQLYGRHIQYCDITHQIGTSTRFHPGTSYSFYHKAMELMPNLKHLIFSDSLGTRNNANHNDLLRASINLQPVPFLRNLQCLTLDYSHYLIFNAVLRANSHVSSLLVGKLYQEDEFDMYSIPLPNLRKLIIKYSYDRNFRKLMTMELQLNLTHLELQFMYIPERLSSVFEGICGKFGETLTNFGLDLGENERDSRTRTGYQEEFHQLRLNLPKLKTFILKLQHFCSLEFLLPVKETLEHLNVDFTSFGLKTAFEEKEKIKGGEEKIRFLSWTGTNSLLDSNIWEELPKLMEVTYFECFPRSSIRAAHYHFTRRDWQMKRDKYMITLQLINELPFKLV